MPPISWKSLAAAQDFYVKDAGYKIIEMPWVASKEAIGSTCDADVMGINSDLGMLVGSAEQSFIDAILAGDLGEGRYQAITPCFRREESHDDIHHPYFMKLELISVYPEGDPEACAYSASYSAHLFAEHLGAARSRLEIVKTPEGFDLECDGIELGSYGVRRYKDVLWVYGTGIAEPRWSSVINRLDDI